MSTKASEWAFMFDGYCISGVVEDKCHLPEDMSRNARKGPPAPFWATTSDAGFLALAHLKFDVRGACTHVSIYFVAMYLLALRRRRQPDNRLPYSILHHRKVTTAAFSSVLKKLCKKDTAVFLKAKLSEGFLPAKVFFCLHDLKIKEMHDFFTGEDCFSTVMQAIGSNLTTYRFLDTLAFFRRMITSTQPHKMDRSALNNLTSAFGISEDETFSFSLIASSLGRSNRETPAVRELALVGITRFLSPKFIDNKQAMKNRFLETFQSDDLDPTLKTYVATLNEGSSPSVLIASANAVRLCRFFCNGNVRFILKHTSEGGVAVKACPLASVAESIVIKDAHTLELSRMIAIIRAMLQKTDIVEIELHCDLFRSHESPVLLLALAGIQHNLQNVSLAKTGHEVFGGSTTLEQSDRVKLLHIINSPGEQSSQLLAHLKGSLDGSFLSKHKFCPYDTAQRNLLALTSCDVY